jgi:PHD/YefM family antitoxin component YafN of YafNO toxin-antitoxin module
MTEVAATEFARNFGRYREAAQRAPVAVTSHDRVTGYFVSAQDFEEYQQLKERARRALAVEELDDATLTALAEARMDARHAHLDKLLDD